MNELSGKIRSSQSSVISTAPTLTNSTVEVSNMAEQSLPLTNSNHKICSIDGCDRKRYGKGFCWPHYLKSYRYGDPLYVSRSAQPPVEVRFWKQVRKTESCWNWLGSMYSTGYGKLSVNGQIVGAHRYSFFLHNGYWPEPMCLHSCDNPLCVNPEHLRAGTHADNMKDVVKRGRHKGR